MSIRRPQECIIIYAFLRTYHGRVDKAGLLVVSQPNRLSILMEGIMKKLFEVIVKSTGNVIFLCIVALTLIVTIALTVSECVQPVFVQLNVAVAVE